MAEKIKEEIYKAASPDNIDTEIKEEKRKKK